MSWHHDSEGELMATSNTIGPLRAGDLLLIDRHPGEKGLAFRRDAEKWTTFIEMPFAASNSNHITTAGVRG
jgi:hypothetical protein